MTNPFACQQYAEKCRALANGSSKDRRREVLRLADIWEGLPRGRHRHQPNSAFRSHRRLRDRPLGFGLDPKILWAAVLRVKFDKVAKEPIPDRFRDLLGRLDAAESRKRRRGYG